MSLSSSFDVAIIYDSLKKRFSIDTFIICSSSTLLEIPFDAHLDRKDVLTLNELRTRLWDSLQPNYATQLRAYFLDHIPLVLDIALHVLHVDASLELSELGDSLYLLGLHIQVRVVNIHCKLGTELCDVPRLDDVVNRAE